MGGDYIAGYTDEKADEALKGLKYINVGLPVVYEDT